MLDIKFIRENAQLVQEAAAKKRIDFNVKKLLEIDKERLEILKEVEDLRAKQNEAGEKISRLKREKEKQKEIEAMKHLKSILSEKEFKLKEIEKEWQKLIYEVPNIPDPSVPEGESDKDNQEIRKWGEPTTFDFEAKDHISLMKELDLADFERGAKVAGFRGYFLKNDAALLSMALWQFVYDNFSQAGYQPVLAPSLVRMENFIGTGWLPQGREEIYKTQDDLYLIGTSEVSMMGFHQDEIFKEEELPKKYLAFSPCFRREAGSYGKDTKGIFRVHQFDKIEMFSFCQPEDSQKEHQFLLAIEERLMQALGLSYRVLQICTGDLGRPAANKYDIEAWVPSENRYRETHSCSYFHDFQTRRLNIRYKDTEGKMRFAHSLNSTAIPTPRILVSLVENYQQEDGSIKIPELLRPYMGKDVIK